MSKFSEHIEKNTTKTLQQEIEERLDKESLEDFRNALKDDSVTIPAILSALAEFGIETSSTTIQRWRKAAKR